MITARLASSADRPAIVRLLTEIDLHYQPTLPSHRPERVETLLATTDSDRAHGAGTAQLRLLAAHAAE